MRQSTKQLLLFWILNARPSRSQTYRLPDRHLDEACLIQVDVKKSLPAVKVSQSGDSLGGAAAQELAVGGSAAIAEVSQSGQLGHLGPRRATLPSQETASLLSWWAPYENLGEQEQVTKDPWRLLRLPNTFKYRKSSSPSREVHLAASVSEPTLFFEWFVFSVWATLFVTVSWIKKTLPHQGLIAWLMLAAIYYALVSRRLGHEAGVSWLTGYSLECIFAFENVFVFHVITCAFQAPRGQIRRAMRLTIGAQVIMQAVLFAGLAERIPSCTLLSSILGVWLICVGTQAAREEVQSSIPIEDSWIARCCQMLVGEERIAPLYAEGGAMFLDRCGKISCTMLFPLVLCLILADFCFQIDITLTKYQEFDNHYVAFTSSALAAFAMPDLFILAQECFRQFQLLKYGTSFALVFLGLQRLLNSALHHEVPALLSAAVVGIITAICILASWLSGPSHTHGHKESDARNSHAAQRSNQAVRLTTHARGGGK